MWAANTAQGLIPLELIACRINSHYHNRIDQGSPGVTKYQICTSTYGFPINM